MHTFKIWLESVKGADPVTKLTAFEVPAEVEALPCGCTHGKKGAKRHALAASIVARKAGKLIMLGASDPLTVVAMPTGITYCAHCYTNVDSAEAA